MLPCSWQLLPATPARVRAAGAHGGEQPARDAAPGVLAARRPQLGRLEDRDTRQHAESCHTLLPTTRAVRRSQRPDEARKPSVDSSWMQNALTTCVAFEWFPPLLLPPVLVYFVVVSVAGVGPAIATALPGRSPPGPTTSARWAGKPKRLRAAHGLHYAGAESEFDKSRRVCTLQKIVSSRRGAGEKAQWEFLHCILLQLSETGQPDRCKRRDSLLQHLGLRERQQAECQEAEGDASVAHRTPCEEQLHLGWKQAGGKGANRVFGSCKVACPCPGR